MTQNAQSAARLEPLVGRVCVLTGASEWMKRNNYWLDGMGDSIDGLVGIIIADYSSLSGTASHYGLDFGDGAMIGAHPMWLIAAD